MKKYHIHLFLLFSVLVLTASSCHKEEPEPDLVPITTTGANTMGFYVDGVPCNKKGEYGGINAFGVSGGIRSNGVLRIFGSGGNPQNSITIYFPLDSLNVENEYQLNKSLFHLDEVSFIEDGFLGGNQYKTNSTHTGKIKLLKLENNMSAGTFYFDAINAETGKVIHVTDGRFDIKFF